MTGRSPSGRRFDPLWSLAVEVAILIVYALWYFLVHDRGGGWTAVFDPLTYAALAWAFLVLWCLGFGLWALLRRVHDRRRGAIAVALYAMQAFALLVVAVLIAVEVR